MNCFQHKIALALDIKSDDQDYHFYRLDNNGTWSHKPGSTNATNLDANGDIIIDPQKADRDYSYKEYEDEDGNIERGKVKFFVVIMLYQVIGHLYFLTGMKVKKEEI